MTQRAFRYGDEIRVTRGPTTASGKLDTSWQNRSQQFFVVEQTGSVLRCERVFSAVGKPGDFPYDYVEIDADLFTCEWTGGTATLHAPDPHQHNPHT